MSKRASIADDDLAWFHVIERKLLGRRLRKWEVKLLLSVWRDHI